ncbi:aquaporin [Luteitalea sp. TBR-22]|uniref:MIP/aquaporin family protein n=1 Tax=Luteitalea sp. TBR-22 TaxID=2802971 RepID=UPI001AF84108|nr:MIP family channel protein [Luteitalea sp. TBR-22]BCS34436.1 aquaporin [Luteitalea sp. TBR-22]
MREALAEFLGTALLLTFGLGVVAQTVTSGGAAGSPLGIHLCWGLAVILGVYASAGVSGAHLNPAVTLALAVRRGFPWSKVGPYVVAQLLGAFVGAAVVYLTYREAITAFDGGMRQVLGPHGTAGIFATYPAPYLSILGGVIDQIVGTALLVAMVFAISDERNAPPAASLAPVFVGLTVMAIGMGFGANAGYAINPARDFGPRLFTALAGWGGGVFTAGNGWWWVPVVAPCIGAVLGGTVYDLLIRAHHPAHTNRIGDPARRVE